MKKCMALSALVLSVFLGMTVFTGCRPNVIKRSPLDYDVDLNIDKDVKETLTLMIPNDDGDVERDYIESLRQGFKELYPNVTIKFDARAVTGEQYATSVASAVSSGNVPDLFWTQSPYYYYLMSKGVAVNLEPYYAAAKEAKTLDLENDYYKAFFDMSLYEGRRYVVPRSMDSVVTFYNTEFLAAAGIDPATDPRMRDDWTWEDLISLCSDVSDFILSDAGKKAGYGSAYALQADFDWEAVFNPIMVSYGAEIFDKEGNITVNTPEMKKMADDLRALKENGRILKDTAGMGSSAGFTNGQIAFNFSSSGPSTMARNLQIKGKFDALPFPLIGEKPAIGCGFVGYAISATATGVKRDLAWAFLQYMISREGQMALINGGLATPSIRLDLAAEKSWSKGYDSLNLDAWLVHEDKKVATDFYMRQKPEYMFDCLTSVQAFMKKVTEDTNKTTTRCIQELEEKLREALNA